MRDRERASTWPSYMRIVVSECCFRLLLCKCMRCDAFIPKIFYFCSSFYYSITTNSADLLPRRCVLIPEGLLSMLHTILRCDSFFRLGWCVEIQIDHFGVDEKKRLDEKKKKIDLKKVEKRTDFCLLALKWIQEKKTNTLVYIWHSPSPEYLVIVFLREKMSFHGNTPTNRAHENSSPKNRIKIRGR